MGRVPAPQLQLVDTVLQLRHSLAQANDRQETTRQEAVRAWTAQRRLQQQLSLSQGRVGVLLEVVRDSVRSMLEFKLEGARSAACCTYTRAGSRARSLTASLYRW